MEKVIKLINDMIIDETINKKFYKKMLKSNYK